MGAIRNRHQDGNAVILEFQERSRELLRAEGIDHGGRHRPDDQQRDRGTDFTVCIIPHTAKVTTLGLKQVGDQVNLEPDLIGKFVERLLQETRHPAVQTGPYHRSRLPAQARPAVVGVSLPAKRFSSDHCL
ncbi:MAG: hypothetical protein U0361_02035 [Nitrospiraceae bacterium]